MKNVLLTLLCAIAFNIIASGQTKKADFDYSQWDYSDAAVLYQQAIDKHPTQYEYFMLGECYRKIARYREAMIAYDRVDSMGHYYENPVFYLYYGWMLNSNDRCDEAKRAFTKYDSLVPTDPRGKLFMNACEIEAADHQGDLPVLVKEITSVNTNGSDFSPAIYRNGIVFTSDRNNSGQKDKWTGKGLLKLYFAERSSADPTYFTQAIGFDDAINDGLTGPACFSKNQDTIYFSRVEMTKSKKGTPFNQEAVVRNKIYSAVMKNGHWEDITPFYLNSDSFSVTHPSLSRDGSRLFFSSDMPGGYGNSDIYYCKREGTKWGKPINAGPNINTMCREGFPSLDSAGNLYFSSEGYSGSGGLNICVSRYENGEYEKALPLKYPFNSSGDDFGLTFLKDQKSGYFSSNRYDGNDDDDIYYFDMGPDSNLVTSNYTMGFKKKPTPPNPLEVMEVNRPATIPRPPTEIPMCFHINFDFDKYLIRPVDYKTLDIVTLYMLKDPKKILEIKGHTDPRGTADYNQVLSENRANAAVKYLVAKGIQRNRLKIAGYGFRQILFKEDVYHMDVELINRRDELCFQATSDNNLASIRDFSSDKRKDTNYADTWYNTAHLKLENGDFKGAISDYSKAIDIYPLYPEAWFGRGQAFDAIHDFENALYDFNTVIQIDSVYTDAYYFRGCNRLKVGDAQGAVEDFTTTMKSVPKYYYLYYLRANAYDTLGKYDQAIADYSTSIELESDYWQSYQGRGNVYLKEGEKTKAEADFQSAHSYENNPVKSTYSQPDINSLKGSGKNSAPADSLSVPKTREKDVNDTASIIYKVQIATSPKPIPMDDPRFKDINNVEMYQDNGAYKYTAGHFDSFDEALVLQNELQSKGFNNAFVVAFKGAKRIPTKKN